MASSVVTGIALEGVGTDVLKTDGLFVYHGLHELHSGSSRQGWNALVELPTGTSTRVNPYTGDITTNALTFVISASDRLATLLMSEQRRPSYLLASDLAHGSSTVDVGQTGLDNSIIYASDETILLGTDSGGGVYTGCSRGFYNSPEQSHDAGTGLYVRVPGWEDRLVTLLHHDVVTGAEEVVGRYHIDDIEMDGPRIIIQTSELLTVWRGAEVNRGAQELSQYAKSMFITPRGAIAGALVGYRGQVRRQNTDGDLVFVDVDGKGIMSMQQRAAYVGDAGSAGWLFDAVYPSQEESIDQMYEVFGIDRASDRASTEDLTYPYHPLAISLALLTSTGKGYNGSYDVLGQSWGLGLDYISWDSWTDEINRHPDMVIDELVLGRGGDSINVFAMVQKLLRTFGYFLSITTDGLLTIERLRLPTLIDWQNAQSSSVDAFIDGPLKLARSMQSVSDNVTALVGGAGSDRSSRVNVRTPERSTRRATLGDARDMELDYTVISRERLGVAGNATSGDLANALVNLLQVNLDAVPRLFIRVARPQVTGEANYNHGRIIRINDLANLQRAWIVDADGNRVSNVRNIDFAGTIIGREYDLKRRTYTLELLFLAYHVQQFIRLRAPSGVVDTVSSAENTIRIKASVFSAADADAFFPNDEIELWTSDGKRWSNSQVRTIDSISGNDLVLNGWFASDPTQNLIVRLASSSNYNNDTIYSLTKRPYAYLAGTSGQIDEDGDTVDADVYGTNIYGGETDMVDGLGSGFVGVDDEAFDTASDDCQPLDTWLEHRLRSNARYLIEAGHQISWSVLSGHSNNPNAYTDIRPYASVNWSTIMYIPWVVQPHLSSIGVYGIGRVGDEGGVRDYNLKLQLDSQQVPGVQEVIEVATNTEALTPISRFFKAELSVNPLPRAQEVVPLALWGQSLESANKGSASLGGGELRGPALYTDTNFYADSAATRPNTDALDTMLSVPGSEGPQVRWDHIMTLGDDDQGMITYPPPTNATTVRKRHMSYMQLRGLEIHQRFADVTSPARSSLEGGKPVLGEIEGMHSIRTNAIYRRARPLWVGPVGQPVPAESGWPSGYVTRFARIAGDATDTAVIKASVFPSTDNPTLLCLLYVLPTFDQTIYSGGNLLGLLEQESLVGDWTVWADCQEIQSGQTWSTAASLGSSYEPPSGSPDLQLEHLPFDLTGQIPALLQEMIVRGKVDAANTFAMREGQLFAPDLKALSLVTTSVDITRDASLERPCRVRVHFEYDTRDLSNPFNNSDIDVDAADAFLTVVGASIWEIPR